MPHGDEGEIRPADCSLPTSLELAAAIIAAWADDAKAAAGEHDFNFEQLAASLLIAALALVVHPEGRVRFLAGSSLMPAIFKFMPRSYDHDFHLDVAGHLCRLFDAWMGLERIGESKYQFTPSNGLVDLCRQRLVFEIILRGLSGSDSTALKYSQFLLKRIVYFSESFGTGHSANVDDAGPKDSAWSEFFFWPDASTHAAGVKQVLKMWEEFFLVFDTVQEPYVHLVEPQIPKIGALLRKRSAKGLEFSLHPAWWIALLQRGAQNSAHPIRRRILDYVLSVRDPDQLAVLASSLGFTAGSLLRQLDEPSQFAVPGLGIFLSPFGEKLSEFLVSLCRAFPTREACFTFLSRTIGALPSFLTRVSVIFVLQGLAMLGDSEDCPDIARCLGAAEINAIVSLLVGERAVSVYRPPTEETGDYSVTPTDIEIAHDLASVAAFISSTFAAMNAADLTRALGLAQDAMDPIVDTLECEICQDAVGVVMIASATYVLKWIATQAQAYRAFGHIQLLRAAIELGRMHHVRDFLQASDITLAKLVMEVDPARGVPNDTGGMDMEVRPRMALMVARFFLAEDIVSFAQAVGNSQILTDEEICDLFGVLVDALGSANFATSLAMMRLAARFLDIKAGSIPASLIHGAIANSLEILKENWTNSRFWQRLLDSFAALAFHESVLSNEAFIESDGILNQAFQLLNKWSKTRVGVMNPASALMHAFWLYAVDCGAPQSDPSRAAHLRSQAIRSLETNMDWVVELLLFGALRDSDMLDQKHEALIVLKTIEHTLPADEVEGFQGTAAWNFAAKDYVVRVETNDIILRLRTDDAAHRRLAKTLFSRLLQIQLDNRYTNQFINTAEHRRQMRSWISIHVLLPFVDADEAHGVLDKLVKTIILEQVGETRCYIEWAIMRLLIAHPSLLGAFWKQLANYDHRAHVGSSLLTIAMHVGQSLPKELQPKYFKEATLAVLPWSSSNHFNMRMFAHYGLFIFWNYCGQHRRDHLASVRQELEHIQPLMDFIATNPECARHRKKCEVYYFGGGGFHPLRDVNVEFLFRGGLTVMQLADDEKISAVGAQSPRRSVERR
nr:Tar (HIV-1) RNA binding protein 1 [Polyrhizophydium stewartii]